MRQAREREEPGLVNAAGSNNLLRLKEILDANPEQVPFFFHSFSFADSIYKSEKFSLIKAK